MKRHDPPLLFDLSADPQEAHALDTSTAPYHTVLTRVVAALQAQMHSVNTTFRSVANYDTNTYDEPCVHLPTSCRSDGPRPPHGHPRCNASEWFNGSIPWAHEGLHPPFAKGVSAASASACCALCALPANEALGCRFWVYADKGECYMKAAVIKDGVRKAPGYVAGSTYPWRNDSMVVL